MSEQYRAPHEGVGPYDRRVPEAENERPPRRLTALLAVLIDWMVLLLMLAAALVVAFVWLLLRTQAGRYDVPTGDALTAFAFVGATVPAWAAWQAHRLYAYGATTGQSLRGLRVEGDPRRRVARVLLHPAATPLWAWVAATAVIGGGWRIALVVLGVAASVVLLTGVSLIVPRHRRPLYDVVTGTRVVRRP